MLSNKSIHFKRLFDVCLVMTLLTIFGVFNAEAAKVTLKFDHQNNTFDADQLLAETFKDLVEDGEAFYHFLQLEYIVAVNAQVVGIYQAGLQRGVELTPVGRGHGKPEVFVNVYKQGVLHAPQFHPFRILDFGNRCRAGYGKAIAVGIDAQCGQTGSLADFPQNLIDDPGTPGNFIVFHAFKKIG